MSTAWVNFVTTQNPNGPHPQGLGLANGATWPSYNATAGGGVGQGIVWSVNGTGSYIERDSWRAEGINWMIQNCLPVFGL
jgi:acetylcholinesterase